VPIALMAGVIGMLLTGVLNMDEAYAAINWKTVFIMAGLIPLGWAVDSSGTAGWIAQGVVDRIGGTPVWAMEIAVGLLTMVFALVVSNVGATVIMVPMAINVAISAGADPLVFALIVALCASNNLLSVSNPVLSMVAGPAGYRGWDLFRIGLPLSLLYILLTVGMVNLVF
jgi:di/tricarboxylate transporter